jgi:hypothetical protein
VSTVFGRGADTSSAVRLLASSGSTAYVAEESLSGSAITSDVMDVRLNGDRNLVTR